MLQKLTVLVLALFMVSAFAAAAEGISVEEKLRQTRDKLFQQKRQVKQDKQEVNLYLNRLSELNGLVSDKERQVASLSSTLSVAMANLQKAEADLQEAEARLVESKRQLGERLYNAYLYGQVSYLEVLLDSESFGDFINRYELLKRIVAQDSVVVSRVQTEKRNYCRSKSCSGEEARSTGQSSSGAASSPAGVAKQPASAEAACSGSPDRIEPPSG